MTTQEISVRIAAGVARGLADGSVWAGAAACAIVLARSPRVRHALALGGLVGLLALSVAGAFEAGLSPAGPSGAARVVGGGVGGALTAALARHAALVAPLWTAGALVLLLRALVAPALARRLAARASLAPLALEQRVSRVASGLGVAPPRVRVSAELDAPAVTGLWRPVLLWPAAALSGLDPAALDALVAHELEHVRRHDAIVELAVRLLVAALCFHPLAWWLARALREAREQRCDDVAVGLAGDPLAYARTLCLLAERRLAAPAGALSARGGRLYSRIERLVRPGRAPLSGGAIVLAVLCAIGAGAVACGAVAETQDDRPLAEASRLAVPMGQGAAGIAWLPPTVRRWAPEIDAAAHAHGVDPDLLAILTLVESAGQPDARSSMGARGLVQVMPQTARRIAEERGLPVPTDDELHDPATNLDLGAWYLAQQLGTLRDADPARTVELAAAAYNGGPRAVRRWLDEGAPLSDETQGYKDRVRALWLERDAPRSATLDALRAR